MPTRSCQPTPAEPARALGRVTSLRRSKAVARALGNSGFSGRPKGARSKFGEAFLEDLLATWNEHGIEALQRCAREEPAQFVRVCASLMPRDFNINATVSAQTVLLNFRAAVEALGNRPPVALPKVKVIDADRS